MKVLYFTATGNNLYVAKEIGGGVPKIVEEFLNKVKLKSKYIFGVATYGAFSGATTRHLLEIGKRNGIEFAYINEILMVDNFLPGFDMNKQVQGIAKKNIEENLPKIVRDVAERKNYIKKHAAITEFIRLQMEKRYNNQFQKNFLVESNCNGCKVCERVCPVDNIKVDKQPVFKDNCQHCLACIQNCPQKAISLKKEKSKARFTNQNVTLKEIIDANS